MGKVISENDVLRILNMMKWILGLLFLSTVGIAGLPNVTGYFGLTARTALVPYIHIHKLHGQPENSNTKMCDSLKLSPEQRELCMRDERMGVVLAEALKLSILHCQYVFRYERWNCSLGSDRLNVLKKAYAESAFLHAITSASLLYTVARACSSSKLERCFCDESHFTREELQQAWSLGRCGDNLRYGLRFTHRFISANSRDQDVRAAVDRHNTDVGIRIARKSLRKRCKCHGVSGSCTTEVCWMELQPFLETAEKLKLKYNSARKVTVSVNNAQVTRTPKLIIRKHKKTPRIPKRGDLVYLKKSPSFCDKSDYSPGTRGRKCDRNGNCNVLCCGRGYNTHMIEVRYRCQCRVIWCCDVKCELCHNTTEIYTCK